MGVADNKTYRNQYHFNDTSHVKLEDVPSLSHQAKINTSIKENPYRSNVNIEKDEIILAPDLSALFKAIGKKHTGGGIDVMLKPNSFVFSDDKSLSFSEKEHELLELKKGGSFKPDKNTPAEVLRRNVNLKHYNNLVNNLNDPNQDDLAKKSSGMMLEKYIESLGNIAYQQEQKKNFPDGLPDFSNGTAPVYNTDLKNEIMEQKQYAKYGGKINPYRADGGYVDDCPCGRDSSGKCLPCSDESKWDSYIKNAKMMGATPAGYNEVYSNDKGRLSQKYTPGSNPYDVPVARSGKGAINNPQWMKVIQSMIDKGATPEDLIKQGHINKNGVNMFKWNTTNSADDFAWIPKVNQELTNANKFNFDVSRKLPKPQEGIDVPEITGDAQGVKRADWQFTPWQKLSQGYNAYQAASVKRYMPYRSKFNPSFVDPSLVNSEQAIGDLMGNVNQQLKATGALNPILRNAQAAAIQGQALNQAPQIRSQYDNQNAGIINQFRSNNNQTRDSATGQNMNNDQQYYQQVINGLTNFDNMKTFQSDKLMNNILRDVESNQSLAYNLLTQNNPAYGFDWKSGNFTRNKKSILDVPTDAKSDLYTDLAQKLMDKMNKGIALTKPEVDFFKGLAVGKLPFSPSIQKKGGKVGYNPYK